MIPLLSQPGNRSGKLQFQTVQFAGVRSNREAAPSGIRRLGRQTSARDFRSVKKIMLGEARLLEKLKEHGEIRAGTMAEAREAYKIETWAKKIGITRQVRGP